MSPTALSCPSCGAPLRWRGDAPVVACRYCGTHVDTRTQAITSAPAQARSQVRPRSVGLAIVATTLVPVGMSVVVLVASEQRGSVTVTGRSVPTQETVPFATVAALSLDTTKEALAAQVPTSEFSDDLVIHLSESGFDRAIFGWDDEAPGHVASVGLYADDGHPQADVVVAWLRHYLGRRLVDDGQGHLAWRWGGAWLNADTRLSYVGAHVDVEKPQWQYRLALLWWMLGAAAQGQDLEPDPAAHAGWLGNGYPVSDLGRLDPAWPVDRVQEAATAALPGATAEVFIGLDVDVPLAHAWFGEVELTWPNEAGGLLDHVLLRPPPGLDAFPSQEALAECLDRGLLRGKREVDDHLRQTWSGRWDLPGGGWLRLSAQNLSVHPASFRGQRMNTTRWQQLLAVLDGCRG